MPRLFLPNFDFEHRLAGESRGGSAAVREASRRLAFAWLLVAEDGDRIVLPESFESEFLDIAARSGLPRVVPVPYGDGGMTGRAIASHAVRFAAGCALVPWGWDGTACALAESLTATLDAPELAAVRRVNSRRFSFELETRWSTGLPGAAAVSSLDQLAEAIRTVARSTAARDVSGAGRWVIKAEFGMSARERVLGQGPTLTEAAAGWARKRLARDGVVFVEPWVDRVDEAGVQIEIPRSGSPKLAGATRLLVDGAGGYAGSAFAADDALLDELGDAADICLRAAAEAQHAGYFGPLGIDVMRLRRADGTIGLRPLQDLNARWTMGRIALGGRRWLHAGEQGEWRPGAVRCATDPVTDYAAWSAAQSPATRVFRTSPFTIFGQAAAAVSALRLGADEFA